MTVREEIDRLLARDHPEPHRVLGGHPTSDGVVFRCFKPGAEWVRVLPEGRDPFQLRRTHKEGVFTGNLAGVEQPPPYELEISYPGWEVVVEHDPYSFLPTVGELDLHLVAEGRHEELQRVLGAHPRVIDGVAGVAFAVWAPSARSISIVGDFNSWDGRLHPMRSLGASGVWELFLPAAAESAVYKYELRTQDGSLLLKADPLATRTEEPPRTGSVVFRSRHLWQDEDWLQHRAAARPWAEPMSIYEVHLGSWRWNSLEGNRSLTYLELADELGDYVVEMGFTHVELLPVMEHPFGGSWGYQVTGFFAPTARFGTPDDFRAFVERLHARGVGVILDWVPAHFPRDDFALARFDGTALYEHADPRRGSHPDWGTLIFNYGRTEVRNFLLASALTWLEDFHADGLRVDAVASMLYLDYSREEGEWLPNVHGGRENLEAVSFLRELNEVVHRRAPGVVMAAEESTAWPARLAAHRRRRARFRVQMEPGLDARHARVLQARPDLPSAPPERPDLQSRLRVHGELHPAPLPRRGRPRQGVAAGEDARRPLATLRQPARPLRLHVGASRQAAAVHGRGARTGARVEPRLEPRLAPAQDVAEHAGVQTLVRDLNHAYRGEPALWEVDFEPGGFRWLEPNDDAANVVAFARLSRDGGRIVVCACNLSPVPRAGYRLGLPRGGAWRELLNTDAARYGGSGAANAAVTAEDAPWHDQPFSAPVLLPPLGVVWLVPEGQ